MPLFAVVIDPSPLAVSGVVAANSVPWLLLAFHAGALADRYERARVMVVSNIVRALILGAMAVLVLTHLTDFALLIVFVLANASVRAVYYSASQATVPELVGPAALNRANGTLFGIEAATENLTGPVVGALAFTAARAIPFVADAAAMSTSSVFLLSLRTNKPVSGAERTRLSEGMSRLLADPGLRVLVSLIASLAGLQGLVSGILVLVATRDWGVHPAAYGLFLATQAVGNTVGGLGADRVASKIGSVPTVLASAFASGAGYLVMSVAHSWALAAPAFALVGFSVGCGGVVAISMRQKLTPDNLMGRVGSAWRGIVWGAAPVGALAAGGIALAGGLRLPLLVAGGAQCVVAGVLARPLSRRMATAEREQAAANPA